MRRSDPETKSVKDPILLGQVSISDQDRTYLTVDLMEPFEEEKQDKDSFTEIKEHVGKIGQNGG